MVAADFVACYVFYPRYWIVWRREVKVVICIMVVTGVLLMSATEYATQRQQITDCQGVLQKVIDALERCAPRGASKIKNFGKALAWPLDKQDTVDLMNSLSRHKTTFILALSADTMFVTCHPLHGLS